MSGQRLVGLPRGQGEQGAWLSVSFYPERKWRDVTPSIKHHTALLPLPVPVRDQKLAQTRATIYHHSLHHLVPKPEKLLP